MAETEQIEGIMCRQHRVELTWVVPKDPHAAKMMRENGRIAGGKHSREHGGCTVEPWKKGALEAS